MTSCLLALRRTFRSIGFLLLLGITVGAVLFVGLSDTAGRKAPAGVCDLSRSEEGARVVSFLLENGFLLFDDPLHMEKAVEQGSIDCGVTLPADFADCVRNGDIENAVRFVRSPSSYLHEAYLNLVSAAIFRERAPYIAAEGFAGTGVTEAEMLEQYFAMLGDGYAFAFDVVTEDGAAIPENGKVKSLTMGTVSVFVMVLVFSSAADLLCGDFPAMSRRIGLRQGMKSVLVPGALVRCALITTAVCLSLLAVGLCEKTQFALQILPAVPVYVLLLFGTGCILSALLPGREPMRLLLPLFVIASLALCPIYTDAALLSPVIGAVRAVLPSYWLWRIADAPLPWLAAALGSLVLAAGILAVRCCVLEKYAWRKNDKFFS